MELSVFYTHLLGLSSPWEIVKVELKDAEKSVHLYIKHESNHKFGCTSCGILSPVYDHNKERVWRHLDTCNYSTYIHCNLPRIECKKGCGVRTIIPPWSRKNSKFTLQFERFAISVLKETESLGRSATQLRITPDQLRYIRDLAIKRGMIRRSNDLRLKVIHLCIDEKSLLRGHHYVTIFYDGETGAVLEVVEHRTQVATALGFNNLEKVVDLSSIEVVSMDMWEAFRNATADKLPKIPIVHDRFHIAQHLNKALDIIRRAENKKLRKKEDERLKGTRYIWLKNPENLKPKQQLIQNDLLKDESLQTVQGWKLKEEFKQFFELNTKEEAKSFFDKWRQKVEQADLKPLVKVSNMIKNHWERMINYFDHKVSNAMAECKNSSIQQIKMKARGFKSAKAFRLAILFFCGQLDLYP